MPVGHWIPLLITADSFEFFSLLTNFVEFPVNLSIVATVGKSHGQIQWGWNKLIIIVLGICFIPITPSKHGEKYFIQTPGHVVW